MISEYQLTARVIDTLLRENYAGLLGRVRVRDGQPELSLPAGLVLPLIRDGFLADFRVGHDGPRLTIDDVAEVLATMSDPLDLDGVAAFTCECRQALAALRLRERHLPRLRPSLARLTETGGYLGYLGYEALAAAMPHPVYPTSESRLGFDDEESLRYAPEYLPEFALRWVAVPRGRVVTAGRHDRRPAGWPAPPEVGLPESLAATHDLMPVHPLTARRQLESALAEAGISDAAVAPRAGLAVIPTLSTRTVAVAAEPASHVKLPLPTSTLGLLNRRFIKPETLADGALVHDVLAAAAGGDRSLGESLLLADDTSYAHASHPYLGYLRRRFPAGLERARIVPLGALLAPSPAGERLVIEELAGGDVRGLLDAYLTTLFHVHVRLFARYGIALEAHQQNTALVLGPPGDGAPRLLIKDFDGALIRLPRLTEQLGDAAPGESAFADQRLLADGDDGDDALADVFITITVHLCAGALAFGLAGRGVAPLPELLGIVRSRLADALDRHDDWPATALLRRRALDADRLPVKSMATAGTLVAKSRSGATDINKFYGANGPNYLKRSL